MFEQRTTFTQQDCNSPLWIGTTYGGYNRCIVIRNPKVKDFKLPIGTVLPDCTGYAFGRFMEIMGETSCLLCVGNAGTWFNYVQDGYDRGLVPALGAIMCFASKTGRPGHVAIVEEILEDGSVVVSQSGDEAIRTWWTGTYRYHDGGYDNGDYIFQGFIYNPSVQVEQDPLSVFLSTAEDQNNQNNEWTCEKTGITKNQAWSAAFVVACAKSVPAFINVVIPNTFSCGSIGQIGVLRNMGQWILGPAQHQTNTPEVGDIVIFRKHIVDNRRVNTYYGDHCGICIEVQDSSFVVMEGDCSGYVRRSTYSFSSPLISGYFRPDWSKVESNTTTSDYRSVQGLYTSLVTKDDACAREVGYLNSNLKPSIHSSNIKLSVLNYTGLLGSLYKVFGSALSTSTASNTADQATQLPMSSMIVSYESTDLSALTPKERECAQVLMSKGLNEAATAAVLANIKAESNFSTSAHGDSGTSFGICQWHLGRGDNMKKFVGRTWSTNLSGQVEFLWHEITTGASYKPTYTALSTCTNDISGAMKAADTFVRNFERPARIEEASKKRQASAVEYFNKMVTQL